MYETRAMLNNRTLQLIDSVGAVARNRIRLLSTQEDERGETEEYCLQALNTAVSQCGYYTFTVLIQIIKLAQVYAAKSRFEDFENAFHEAERIYLCLHNEPESSTFLDLLISLNWKLCTIGRGSEAHRVNNLIAQIKMLDQESAATV